MVRVRDFSFGVGLGFKKVRGMNGNDDFDLLQNVPTLDSIRNIPVRKPSKEDTSLVKHSNVKYNKIIRIRVFFFSYLEKTEKCKFFLYSSFQTHPKFLHSNSTSHVWPFGAIAELIDNAMDPDANATAFSVRNFERN